MHVALEITMDFEVKFLSFYHTAKSETNSIIFGGICGKHTDTKT